MHFLVTGGTGQLGSEIYKMLLKLGHACYAPGHDELDVTDSSSVERAFGAIEQAGMRAPDAVIHCAAYTDVDRCETEPDRAYRVNEKAALLVARQCGLRGIPMVFISTDYVFDGAKRVPYTVSDCPKPLNVYGKTKLAGEMAVRETLRESFIIRTSWMFGIEGRNFVKSILAAASSGRELKVVDDQVGCPTYAGDLSRAILELLGVEQLPGVKRYGTGAKGPNSLMPAAPYGTYHFSNSGSISWFGFASEILKQAGWEVGVSPISSDELSRPARRPSYSVLDLTEVQRFGIQTRPWREALADFMLELEGKQPQLTMQKA